MCPPIDAITATMDLIVMMFGTNDAKVPCPQRFLLCCHDADECASCVDNITRINDLQVDLEEAHEK